MVSSQNNIRILDGLTGTVLNTRTLDPPFQSADTGGCGDIPNTVGITGTPIIDPVGFFLGFLLFLISSACELLWEWLLSAYILEIKTLPSLHYSIRAILTMLTCFAGYKYHVPVFERLQKWSVSNLLNQVTRAVLTCK